MKANIFLLILFFISNIANAQKKHTFYFSLDEKAYEGKYKPKRINEERIYNTYTYLLNNNELEYTVAPASIEDVEYLSENVLNQNIDDYFNLYNQMNIPKDSFWENVRQQKIHLLLERGRLRKIILEAYQDPKKLEEFQVPQFSAAEYYRQLIFSNDTLKMADAVCDLQEIYFEELKDETYQLDKLRFYLISLGFWNEAQKYLPQITPYKILKEQFLKLFKKVKVEE